MGLRGLVFWAALSIFRRSGYTFSLPVATARLRICVQRSYQFLCLNCRRGLPAVPLPATVLQGLRHRPCGESLRNPNPMWLRPLLHLRQPSRVPPPPPADPNPKSLFEGASLRSWGCVASRCFRLIDLSGQSMRWYAPWLWRGPSKTGTQLKTLPLHHRGTRRPECNVQEYSDLDPDRTPKSLPSVVSQVLSVHKDARLRPTLLDVESWLLI